MSACEGNLSYFIFYSEMNRQNFFHVHLYNAGNAYNTGFVFPKNKIIITTVFYQAELKKINKNVCRYAHVYYNYNYSNWTYNLSQFYITIRCFI